MVILHVTCYLTDGMKYWTKSVSTDSSLTPWEKRKGNAINIELTGYVLLTLAANDNRQVGLMVLKWLTSQRNPEGGYSSTQVGVSTRKLGIWFTVSYAELK